jgi:hypothetical protein
MSFLSNIVSFGKKAYNYGGYGNTLVKTALLGFALSKLSKNANKGNDGLLDPNRGPVFTSIDGGVRLQVEASTDNAIPVLYGDAFFGGIISDAEMSSDAKTMYFAMTLSERTGTIQSTATPTAYTYKNIYRNNQRLIFKADGITVDYAVDRSGNIDRSLDGLAKVYCYAGSSADGVVPVGYTNGSYPTADTIMPSWGAATHTMNELVFAIIEINYSREKGITDLGEFKFNVASDMIYPGDALYDYMTNTRYGAGIPAADIDSSLAALTTYSQQTVNYTDATTGAQVLPDRYQINGLLDTNVDVLQNIERVCNICASWLTYNVYEGVWGVIINKADTSVASFSDTNILSNISVQGTGLDDLYNNVKVEFANRDIEDRADFVNIEIPAGDRNANEYDNTLRISYDIINEPVQAELLGFIELKQSRVDLIVTFEADYSYLSLKAGEVIDVTNSRFGWTNKLFRVITLSEQQDEDGAITIAITALEYDANVYDTTDLSRFTRSNSDGIVTIGDIGKPGTPTIVKFEAAARPRFVATSTTPPRGVVEGLEFWVSTDVGIAESSRNYNLISLQRPAGGGNFSFNEQVILDYDTIGDINFTLKTRAVNDFTAGPFSDPSDITNFVSAQTTQRIDPTTQVDDGLGGLLLAVGLTELLKLLDNLLLGDAGIGGLFDKIFEVFQTTTGVDLVGDATAGNLGSEGPPGETGTIGVQGNGVLVSSVASILNFVGDDITVTLTGDVLNIIHGDPTNPPEPPVIAAVDPFLFIAESCPPDIGIVGLDCSVVSEVPRTGPYYMRLELNRGVPEGGVGIGPDIPLNAAYKIGAGFVNLYKSNGVLVEAVSANDLLIINDVVEVPFAPRELGCDYYVTYNSGLITFGPVTTKTIDDPGVWNFTVAPVNEEPYPETCLTPSSLVPYTPDSPAATTRLSVIEFTPEAACPSGNTLSITFSEPIAAGSGSVVVVDTNTNTPAFSFNVTAATVTDATAEFGVLNGLTPNTKYRVDIPAGAFVTIRDNQVLEPASVGTSYITPQDSLVAQSFAFNSFSNLEFSLFRTCSYPFDDSETLKVNVRSSVELFFTRPIEAGTAPAYVYIYDAISGDLHQRFDVAATFASDNYGADTVVISSNKLTLNPTCEFKQSTRYYVTINAGALLDSGCDGQSIAAISSSTAITWTTDGVTTSPVVYNPADGDLGDATVAFNLDRPSAPGKTNINVFDESGALVGQIPADDPAVTFT